MRNPLKEKISQIEPKNLGKIEWLMKSRLSF
jgi:hypothetical protein